MTTDDRSTENRLRRVLAEEARSMSPTGDGLDAIRARATETESEQGGRPRWLIPGLAAAAVAAVVLAFVILPNLGDDDSSAPPAGSPTDSASPSPSDPVSTTPSPTPTPTPTPSPSSSYVGEQVLAPDGQPIITIDSTSVSGRTVTVTGTAVAFEATVNWEIVDSSGSASPVDFATATIGAPERGDYTFTYDVPSAGTYTVRVFETSAEDGSRRGIVERTVIVT